MMILSQGTGLLIEHELYLSSEGCKGYSVSNHLPEKSGIWRRKTTTQGCHGKGSTE
jgi:hypothetical protein